MAIIRCANGHFYNTDFYQECPFCQNMENPSGQADNNFYSRQGPSGTYMDDDEPTVPLYMKGSSYSQAGERSLPEDDDVTVPLMSADRFGAKEEEIQPEGDDDITVPLLAPNRFYNREKNAGQKEDDDITVALRSPNRFYASGNGTLQDEDEERTMAILPGQRTRVTGWLVCVEGELKGRDFRIHEDNNWIGAGDKNDICLRGAGNVSVQNHCSIIYDRVNIHFFLVGGNGEKTRLNEAPLGSRPAVINKGDRLRIGDCVFEFIPFCMENHVWK